MKSLNNHIKTHLHERLNQTKKVADSTTDNIKQMISPEKLLLLVSMKMKWRSQMKLILC